MSTLLILEDKVKERITGYDHVFSFCSNPADSFPHHYLTEEEAKSIYDQVYRSLIDDLSQDDKKEAFSYRNVDLLWCFKKGLFEFTYYLKHRYEIFKKMVSAYHPSDIYLKQGENVFQYPRFIQIMEGNPSKHSPRIHLLEDLDGCLEERGGGHPLKEKGRLWSGPPKWGRLEESEICIFSDFEKSKSVLGKIKEKGCVLFSNYPSPRTWLRALRNRVAFYQVAYRLNQADAHHEKARELTLLLKEHQPFSDFFIEDLQVGRLLGVEIKRLFQSVLPKLLFEIDELHRFFSEAKNLKTALLDEDVNMTKNAFCQVARQYGVTSFVEIHGAIARPIGVLPLTADKVFAWGRLQKEKLIAWGCPEDQIIVSGCSRYRHYQQLDEKRIRAQVAKRFGFDPAKKIILLALPTTTISRGRFIFEEKVNQNIHSTLEAISDILEEDPSLQLLFKIHPGDENAPSFMKWTQEHRSGGRVAAVERFDPILLAKAADFLITYMSTYAVEALALDKPVIYLFGDDDYGLLSEMRGYNAFFYPRDREELKSMIRQLLRHPELRPGRWQEAKKDYLSEGVDPPEEVIASQLVNPGALPPKVMA